MASVKLGLAVSLCVALHCACATADGRLSHSSTRLEGRRMRTSKTAKDDTAIVYVYELPSRFMQDIIVKAVQWHPQQYDTEMHFYHHMLKSKMRTKDPQRAKLFYVPIFASKYYNQYWQQWSPPGDPFNRSIVNWDTFLWAMGNTSILIGDAIRHVRQQYPFWDRYNGADHFMVFAFDHGRCEEAVYLKTEELGDSFALETYADLTTRSDWIAGKMPPAWTLSGATVHGDSYDWAVPDSWACFKPNADIAIPPYASEGFADIVKPGATNRTITALMRFEYRADGDGKFTISHHGHRLRWELIDQFKVDPIPGAEMGKKSSALTGSEMQRSIFCVCPPGRTQWTSRVWRAIVSGCIPVTFFRSTELPFANNLGVRHEDFMVNIQPDDYRKLKSLLSELLNNPPRLARMQAALERVQDIFVFNDPHSGASVGAWGAIEQELLVRAQYVGDYRYVFN